MQLTLQGTVTKVELTGPDYRTSGPWEVTVEGAGSFELTFAATNEELLKPGSEVSVTLETELEDVLGAS